MLNCCLSHCSNSKNASKFAVKLHELPKNPDEAKRWIELCPEMELRKRPALCSKHFKKECYNGKSRRYLKPGSLPSIFLTSQSQEKEGVSFNNQCNLPEHHNLEKILLRLEQTQKNLRTELQDLKRTKVAHLRPSVNQKKDLIVGLLKNSRYLGPTQVRCLANNSSKGRGWTLEEKQKAFKLKNLCNRKCYEFVRKKIVPLPSIWELNSSNNEISNNDFVQIIIKN